MAFIAFIARRVWWIPHIGAGSPQPGRRRLVLGMSIILASCPARGGEQVVDHRLLFLDRYVAPHAHHGLYRLHHLGNRSTRVETPTQRSRPPPRMVRSGERQSPLAPLMVFMVFVVFMAFTAFIALANAQRVWRAPHVGAGPRAAWCEAANASFAALTSPSSWPASPRGPSPPPPEPTPRRRRRRAGRPPP